MKLTHNFFSDTDKYHYSITEDDGTKSIVFSEAFKHEFKTGDVFVWKAKGTGSNLPKGIIFEDFIAASGVLKFHLLGSVCKYKYSTESPLNFNFKRIKPTCLYPEILNDSITHGNEICKAFFFYVDDFDGARFLKAVSCRFSELFKNAILSLNRAKIGANEVQIGHFQGNSEMKYMTEASLTIDAFGTKEVMTVWIKSVDFIPCRIDGRDKPVLMYPTIPRKLLRYSMQILAIDPNYRSAGRLAALALHSSVPVHLLQDLIPGVVSENLEQVSLPLDQWERYLACMREDRTIKIATENLFRGIEQHSDRKASWTAAFCKSVLETFLFSTEKSNYNYNQGFQTRWNHPVASRMGIDHVDLAVISNEFKPLPFLLIDLGSSQDFTTLLTLCAHTCIKMVYKCVNRGLNSINVKVFGLMVRDSQIRLCVAHPVFTENPVHRVTDVSVHLICPSEWQLDIFESSRAAKSSRINTTTTTTTRTKIEATIVPGLTDFEIPCKVPKRFPTAPSATAQQKPAKSTKNPTINYASLCKLKVFIECAKEAERSMDEYSAYPFKFRLRPRNEDEISIENSTKSTEWLPLIQACTKSDLQEMKGPCFYPGSKSLKSFEITKKRSYEADVYLDSGLFLPFLPRLLSITNSEKGPDYEKFLFEHMDPLIESYGGLSDHFRTGFEVLEAVTFAIHTLFELHILHTKLGFVHSDISPNNIMFSKLMGIWKLNDFNHSLPIDESLRQSRKGGTRGYRDPEAERSGIFTPASDVYSLGQVLVKLFRFSDSCEEDLNAINEFNRICGQMTTDDPKERITCRDALKCFYYLFLKLEIPRDFVIYGHHSIFPLVEREFLNDNEVESSEATGNVEKESVPECENDFESTY